MKDRSVYRCPTCNNIFHFPTLTERNHRFIECCPECGEDEIEEGYICPVCGRFHRGTDSYCEKCKDFVQNDLVEMMVETGTFINTTASQTIDLVERVVTSRLTTERAVKSLQEKFDQRDAELCGRK